MFSEPTVGTQSVKWNQANAVNSSATQPRMPSGSQAAGAAVYPVVSGWPVRGGSKTSHTRSLVSGEFLTTIVFPVGACFSRPKHDDVCHRAASPAD